MNPPEERRIRLTLHYDGGAFFGWQVQPAARTVQAELEAALSRLLDRPVRTAAAGRTDRGVHATGQVVTFDAPSRWSPASLQRALNAVLPADIWVQSASVVEERFHARFSATAREYEYRVGTAAAARSPFHDRWCWALMEPLDRTLLDECAARIIGDHSFRAFAKAGQEHRGDRCIVQTASWREWEAGACLTIRANRFLHHMVRYLVGTMVEIARGRRDIADLDRLLAGDEALATSPPAPPQGLFLTHVYYDSPAPEPAENRDG